MKRSAAQPTRGSAKPFSISMLIENAPPADRRGGRRWLLPRRAGGTRWAFSIAAVRGRRFTSARRHGTALVTGALRAMDVLQRSGGAALPRASRPEPWLEWVGALIRSLAILRMV